MTNLNYEKNIRIDEKDALIVVDMQNDFLPGGSLPVEEGDLIIEEINMTAKKFKNYGGFVVLTQDWHPKNHLSFASNHQGRNPGDEFMAENTEYPTIMALSEAILKGEANFTKIPWLRPVLRLHPPRKGYRDTKQDFTNKGDQGYRAEAITILLKKMS